MNYRKKVIVKIIVVNHFHEVRVKASFSVNMKIN